MMASVGLKVGGTLRFVRGDLEVKLPRERVNALVQAGSAGSSTRAGTGG